MNAGERRALWHYRLRGYRIIGHERPGRPQRARPDRPARQRAHVRRGEAAPRRGFGGAVGAVDAEKQRRVRRAAQVWLSRNPQPDDVRVGFEVVAVEEGRLVRIPVSLIES